MFSYKANTSLWPIKTAFKKTLLWTHFECYFHGKINTVAKRGSMLQDMIANKDKRKNWEKDFASTKPKVRVFDKIHRPHRRRAVLNSLFIKNITDVISTGDTAIEAAKYGIEITGVQVSPCMRIVNVFWQVSANHYDSCDDIGKLLSAAAPKIRAELISRNVLGRVPHIFFLRDATNAHVSAFEEAMKKLDLEPKTETGIISDDSFTEDLYKFKDSKDKKKSGDKVIPESEDKVKEKFASEEKREKITSAPLKPIDMKCDVFGLDHAQLMQKVIALKKKKKEPPQNTALIFPEHLKDNDDLFSKIPGVCFHPQSSESTQSRDAILKKFQIERRMLRERKKPETDPNSHLNLRYNDNECDDDNNDDAEFNSLFHDYIEDETTDQPK